MQNPDGKGSMLNKLKPVTTRICKAPKANTACRTIKHVTNKHLQSPDDKSSMLNDIKYNVTKTHLQNRDGKAQHGKKLENVTKSICKTPMANAAC